MVPNSNSRYRLRAAIAGLCLAGPWSGALIAEESVTLREITVKGEALEERDSAFTVNVIDSETIRGRQVDEPLRLMEQVPGMDLGAYQQGGIANVFTIRGITDGGHGSGAGISLDGISLNQGESHADGYADTNIIIPLELEKLTVFKGPVSPLYGNYNRGGVLAFTTRKGGEYTEADFALGQYKTFDAQAAIGGKFGELDSNIAVQAYDTDGWRDNSRYTKTNMSARFAYPISADQELALSLRGHGGQWEAPGYIPESQFTGSEDDRKTQAINQENDGGEKQWFAGRLDYNHAIDDDTKLLLFVYRTQNYFTRFAKFGYTAGGQTERYYNHDAIALGGSWNRRGELFGHAANWVVGAEYYDEETDWKRWNTSDRVRTAATEERNFTIDTASLFTQLDLDMNPRFRPTLGLRYDNFTGEYINNDPGGTPFSRDMSDFDHFSPKLGMRSSLSDSWELRASAANGFALPDGVAKYDPALNVDTVEYWQYEIGVNGTPTPDWMLDLAYFVLDTSDEILEDPIGSGTFRNVGETRRSGLEADIRYFVPAASYLTVSSALAFFDSEIRSNPDASLLGKQVVGLPEHIINMMIEYAPPQGWGGRLAWRQVGAYPLTDDNTAEYEGYDVTTAGVFYQTRYADGRKLKWYLDINNLTDEVYAEAVFFGFGTTNYAPAPPTNLTAGVAMTF